MMESMPSNVADIGNLHVLLIYILNGVRSEGGGRDGGW